MATTNKSKKLAFDFDRFAATEDDFDKFDDIQLHSNNSVFVPKILFRVNPDKSRVKSVYTAQINGHWYLVAADIHKQYRFDKKWKTQLFEAMDEDGHIFLIPCTEAIKSWRQSLLSAIKLAKNQWIEIQSDSNKYIFVAYSVDRQFPAVEWPEESIEKVIEAAFQNRMIVTHEDAEKYFEKRTRRIISEDD